MSGTPQARNTCCNTCKRVGSGRASKTNRGCRGVLLVVGMKNENAVHSACQNRIDFIILTRNGKAHVEEVCRKIEIIHRIHKGLADLIFMGYGCGGWQFCHEADGGHDALMRISYVG